MIYIFFLDWFYFKEMNIMFYRIIFVNYDFMLYLNIDYFSIL